MKIALGALLLAVPASAGTSLKVSPVRPLRAATFVGAASAAGRSFRLADATLAAPGLLLKTALPVAKAPALSVTAAPTLSLALFQGVEVPRDARQGAAFFDGARLDGSNESNVPREPSPAEKLKALSQEQSRYADAAYAEILPTLGSAVSGWETRYANKPSFPFVVERQGRKYAAVAADETAANQARVEKLAASAGLAKAVWMAVQKRLTGVEPEFPIGPSPEFEAFHAALKKAAAGVSYDSGGTLVVVGWGDADHDSAYGDTPDGPKTVSRRLADAVARYLFAARREALEKQVYGR